MKGIRESGWEERRRGEEGVVLRAQVIFLSFDCNTITTREEETS